MQEVTTFEKHLQAVRDRGADDVAEYERLLTRRQTLHDNADIERVARERAEADDARDHQDDVARLAAGEQPAPRDRSARGTQIAEHRERERAYHDAAAALTPRIDELSLTVQAHAREIQILELQPKLRELHDQGAAIEAALERVAAMLPAWRAFRADVLRRYEHAHGEPLRVDQADLVIARTVSIWVRQLPAADTADSATLGPLVNNRYPLESAGLNRGLPEPSLLK